ncbi:hypothetical protein RvY_18869-2 [Ramazzottius varieornatus]|uniref:Uncharacterized protein n=1 Tax=Ramazzottius varieornatus TaxID=947166 RepID=A0A1D1WB88_RAMVA|nr:hypothetical protein RvY_18869-2 [Ramazzottius varieornatus]
MLQTFRPRSLSSLTAKEGIYDEPDSSSCRTCSVESTDIPGDLSASSPECPPGHYDIPVNSPPFLLPTAPSPMEEKYSRLSVLRFSPLNTELVEEKGRYRFGESFGIQPSHYSAASAFELAASSAATSSTPVLRFHWPHPCPSSSDPKTSTINGYLQEPFRDPLQLTELQAKPVRAQCAKLWKNASMLYGVFISTTSISLTLASNLTHNINSVYARWFNVAMTSMGICFLVLAYFLLIRKRKRYSATSFLSSQPPHHLRLTFRKVFSQEQCHENTREKHPTDAAECIRSERAIGSPSFYHSFGALVFAIGSLVYTCLDVGVYVENRACLNIVKGVEPGLFAIFLTMQLYLVFQISQLRLSTRFHYALCWFGLIHLVATDLSVWIRILFDETHHAISLVAEKEAQTNHSSPMWLMVDNKRKDPVSQQLTTVGNHPFTGKSPASCTHPRAHSAAALFCLSRRLGRPAMSE